jgi:crotonobetainyl-CoA:carnitine CoA-transferase CaiB-like acyl-CoA transferase
VIVAGATVGQLVAQLGARVIRVGNMNFPDGMRRSFDWSTPAQARRHRGKESVGLDLRSDQGRRIFLDLARQADVVASNLKPCTVERLGIFSADLAEVNQRIVCVESRAFGHTGPLAHRDGLRHARRPAAADQRHHTSMMSPGDGEPVGEVGRNASVSPVIRRKTSTR